MRTIVGLFLAAGLVSCSHSGVGGTATVVAPAPTEHAAHVEPEHHPRGLVEDHVLALFAHLDHDGDEFITRDEAAGHHLLEEIDAIDTNADGQISLEEMTVFETELHEQL